MHRVIATLALAWSACLAAPTRCPDGTTCPAGEACAAAGDRYACGPAAAVAACADRGPADPTGLPCAYAGVAAGVCVGTICRAVGCGNGFVDDGEFCDDGNTRPVGPDDACNASCTSDETCGNGVPDYAVGEACDCGDGTVPLPGACALPNGEAPGATCRADCSAARCGDGLVVAPEQCEAGQLGEATCEDVGYYGGTLACGGACSYDVAACVGRCGDGEVNGPELCDGVAEIGCAEFGFALGRPTCTAACGVRFEPCRAGFPASLGDAGGGSYAHQLWGPSRQELYLASERGLFQFNGSTWTEIEDGLVRYGVHGVVDGTAVHAIAVGPFDAAVLTAGAWQPLAATGSAVWVSSPTEAWVVGASIIRCDPSAGTCATPTPLAVDEHLSAIASSGPGHVVAVGARGSEPLAMRWDGATWTELTAPPIGALTGVWTSGPDEVLVIDGDLGRLRRWDGVDWAKRADTGALSFGLWGTGPDDLYTTGAEVRHFDGATWRRTTLDSATISPAQGHVLPSGEVLLPRHPELARMQSTVMVPEGPVNLASRADGTLWTAAGSELRANGEVIGDVGDVIRDLVALPEGRVAYLTQGGTLHVDGSSLAVPDAGVLAADGPTAVVVTTTTGIARFDGATLTDLGAPVRSWSALATADGVASYAGTGDGQVWGRDGATWTEVELPAAADLFVVSRLWASGDTLVVLGLRYAAGGNPEAVIAHRRGDTWAVVALPTAYGWAAIDGTGPDDLAALGSDGTVLLFDGLGWLPYVSGVLSVSDVVLSRSRLSIFSASADDHTITRAPAP